MNSLTPERIQELKDWLKKHVAELRRDLLRLHEWPNLWERYSKAEVEPMADLLALLNTLAAFVPEGKRFLVARKFLEFSLQSVRMGVGRLPDYCQEADLEAAIEALLFLPADSRMKVSVDWDWITQFITSIDCKRVEMLRKKGIEVEEEKKAETGKA